MATVIFYEKPGCINNTRQKALLQAAGHQLEVHDLLRVAWTSDRLRPFFGQHPVVEWFNPNAPPIKSGEIIPEQLDADTALALIVANPLLIRRPLLQVEEHKAVGFDPVHIDAWIGLSPATPEQQSVYDRFITADLQTCPHS